MNYEFDGLPLHILLVHAVVVMLPVTALCTAATMLWPGARRRLGVITPLLGLLCVPLVILTQKAGEWLLQQVRQSPAILAHANDGRTLLPWAWALFGASAAAWCWHHFSVRAWLARRIGPTAGWMVTALFALLVLGVCAGVSMDVVVIGEAGSRAVWGGLLRS